MSNNKQSSVEWLFEQVWINPVSKLPGILEQAKAMHKEEIIYATEVGYTNGNLNNEYDGHQHYKETFNQETK